MLLDGSGMKKCRKKKTSILLVLKKGVRGHEYHLCVHAKKKKKKKKEKKRKNSETLATGQGY